MSENAAGLIATAGTRLHERYELMRRLYAGPGGTTVWLAHDSSSGSDVVVKTSRRGDALRREWETLRAINHGHVVRAFDFIEDEPGLFAQYFVDGPSLADLGRIPLSDLLRPIRLIAGALTYLHRRDVSHGDVTPANVVFDHGGAPFLIDFGSASRGSVAVGGGDGTPAYRSPERGPGGVATPADDVYALGRLLGEYAGDDCPADIRALIASMTGPVEARPAAAEVDAALAAAGVAAATLPERSLRRTGRSAPAAEVADIVVPTRSRTVRAAAVAGSPAPAAARGRGLSPVVVVAGVVLLLGLFGAVLLWLDRQPDNAAPLAAATATVDEPDAADQPAATESADAAGTDDWQEPTASAFGEQMDFTEGSLDTVLDTSRLTPKQRAGRVLGELLAKQEILEGRGVASWAPVEYQRALEFYDSGDEYYLADDFPNAERQYRKTVAEFDRLIGRVTGVYTDTVAEADAAFASGDSREAERLYGIALEITPNDPHSNKGLERSRNLDDVLALVEAAGEAEFDGDYAAAKAAYDKALDIDPVWQPAVEGAARMATALLDQAFREQMTEGFLALDAGRLAAARRAFAEARKLKPESYEPADGLLQVDQAARLSRINILKQDAATAETEENWPAAIALYEKMLGQDDKLALARDGLANARARLALDETLKRYLGDPDILTNPKELKAASGVLTRTASIEPMGPRLAGQREALTAALKRAATPVKVELVSDEQTNVAVFKVGRLGQFERTTLVLRPGLYTAVGTRVGYRDVRLEFRVAPEDPPGPIVVRCEEPI